MVTKNKVLKHGLDAKKYRLCELFAEGKLHKTKIAQELGISIHTVYAWLREDKVQTTLAEFREVAKQFALNLLNESLRPIIGSLVQIVVNGTNDGDRIQAAKELLDRAGILTQGQSINFYNQQQVNLVEKETGDQAVGRDEFARSLHEALGRRFVQSKSN